MGIDVTDKADFIWSIADKITGVYKPHEYGLVILPLTVLRRFDCVLKSTKEEVLKVHERNEADNLNDAAKDLLLRKASKASFYNTSRFTFEKLVADPDNIESNLRNYINGFSPNVREIIEKFRFDVQITTMAEKGILYLTVKEFTSPAGDFHPDKVSNIEMGYIFEEIIRRFSESHNEDAGQHYTPREVIELMTNILFINDGIISEDSISRTLYDPACGTGGMLSVAEEHTSRFNMSSRLICFGQEINDQTYAICKADRLIKGGTNDRIECANTLSDDRFANMKFDYVLSNPPFGREWKNEKVAVEKEAKLGERGRFGVGLPSISDSQMLFLLTAISKMKQPADSRRGGGARRDHPQWVPIVHRRRRKRSIGDQAPYSRERPSRCHHRPAERHLL